MNVGELEKEFRQKICDEIAIESEGLSRFIIYTPFMFDDGDHFVVVLKKANGQWLFTDEGHTFMHISYREVNLSHGARKSFIDQSLLNFNVENTSGELCLKVPNSDFGDSLFSFIQALTKINDTSYWTRERVRSTFFEDFRHMLEDDIPPGRRIFEYTIPDRDPDGIYPVDCKVNSMRRPIFIYGINNDAKCRDATICLHQHERWGVHFRGMGIFEDQTQINNRVLARFSDIAEKLFSSLGAKDRIQKYLDEALGTID